MQLYAVIGLIKSTNFTSAGNVIENSSLKRIIMSFPVVCIAHDCTFWWCGFLCARMGLCVGFVHMSVWHCYVVKSLKVNSFSKYWDKFVRWFGRYSDVEVKYII